MPKKLTGKHSLAALTEPAPGALATPSAMQGGFVDRKEAVLPKGVIIKSFAPLIKPINWPKGKDGVNMRLVGKFVKIFTTQASKTKTGLGIEIVPDGAPVGVALPVTATLRTGLAISGEAENAKSEYMGRYVAIELLDEKLPSKKGQSAWNFVVAIYPNDYKALPS